MKVECPNCHCSKIFTETKIKRLIKIKVCVVLFIPFVLLSYFDFRTIWVFLSFFCFFLAIIEAFRINKKNKGVCLVCKHKWEY